MAIPLPGTGGWTGALIASVLKMRLKDSLPPIIAGVLVAGFVMTLLPTECSAAYLVGEADFSWLIW